MLNPNFAKTVIAPSLSYGFIIWLFSKALFNPIDNINFIFNVGMFIFLTEFLSIHSSVMLTAPKKTLPKIIALIFYVAFVLIFSVATHTYYPAALFTLSLVAKLFGKPPNYQQLMGTALIFMSSLFITIFATSAIKSAFIFPQQVLEHKAAGSSGLFVDTPQTLLVWGMLYYTGLIVFQIWLYKKGNQTSLKTK